MNSPRFDEEGYLIDPTDWSEDVARYLAEQENIQLTDEHWQVIAFMRTWQQRHGLTPDVRHVIRHMRDAVGASRNRVFELFPYGYVQQACRIAGMKRPRAWSTG